ncbi:MAG: iron ABC transporter permease [Alphaproteobacteria bacterium]|nr:iron ABC transporter permease [Alphaproteobacteria bacterium]
MEHHARHRLLFCLALLSSLVVLLPVAGLVGLAAFGTGDLWPHLVAYVLPDALRQTTLLLIGTGTVTAVTGAGLAWLITGFHFPGRRWLEWAVLLPLAIPTYIVAYAYLDVLHPIGPVQSTLRAMLGISDVRGLQLPDVRSMAGCILVMSASLYPYVYVSTRAALLTQSLEAIEAARGLGAAGAPLMYRVTLPLALPAVCAGLGLVLLETLADIGASEFLGVRTLTVAVYVTWTTRGSVEGAAQIALAMLALTFTLLAWERAATRWRDREISGDRSPFRVRLTGLRAALATVACTVPLLLGFGLPTLHLLVSAAIRVSEFGLPAAIGAWMWNSAYLAMLATLVTLACGITVTFCHRYLANIWSLAVLRIAALGYAMPGTVLAVGLLGPMAQVDNAVLDLLDWIGAGFQHSLISGSILMLVIAYVVRFLAIPLGMLETAYGRMPVTIDDAARGLGAANNALAWRIHLPILAPSLSGAALLVLIECMKELPATLLLRPLNVETLATAIYAEASRGTYEDGAVAALSIVLLGVVPVIVLVRRSLFLSAPPITQARRQLLSQA